MQSVSSLTIKATSTGLTGHLYRFDKVTQVMQPWLCSINCVILVTTESSPERARYLNAG